MTNEKREAIWRIASLVRETIGLSVPTELEGPDGAVEKLQGRVVTDQRGELPVSAHGRISRIENGNGPYFEIKVHPEVSVTRRRFTIAHELGHLFLHMRYWTEQWSKSESVVTDGAYYYRSENRPYLEIEKEADEFGGELLMPRKEFTDAILRLFKSGADRVDIREIARQFNVSPSAAQTRGQILGTFHPF